jgi:hypothetical protein
MLRMYVMEKPTKWEEYLHLVEFSYNNGYQESIKMSLFEALYGRKCNTPVSWDNPNDRKVVGTDLLRDMKDQIVKIRHNLKATQDKKKIYANKHRTPREFSVGDHVFFKVKPRRSSLRLGKCSKLEGRYYGSIQSSRKEWSCILYACITHIHAYS